MGDDSDDFRVVTVTCISQVTEVRVYEETAKHVLDRHPEISRTFVGIPTFDAAIDKALTDPTYVGRSHSNSYVFVDEDSTNWAGEPLRIPVKVFANTTSAHVKTVFFGTSEEGDDLVYKKVES